MAWLVKLRKLREQYAQHRPQSQAMCKHNSVSEERGQPSKAYTQPPAHTLNASRLLGSVCPPRKVDCLLPSRSGSLLLRPGPATSHGTSVLGSR